MNMQAEAKPGAHTVAIIGLGPKGLYCLERLVAEFNARPLLRALNIYVFNRSSNFGASPIYDPAQPQHILLNVSVSEIDLWTAENPPAAAGRGTDFVNWHREKFRPENPLTGNEYLPRSIVGQYLTDGFRRIVRHLPHGVSVSCRVGEVVDVRRAGLSYELEFIAEGGKSETISADKIMLATGHSRVVPDETDRRYAEFASKHRGLMFIPFVYPVVEAMGKIPVGARVAMKGVGLSFIDAALELTEGRGGSFRRSPDGELSYERFGNEPSVIIPFCRSGLPMAPKADDLPDFMRPLTFFTAEALEDIRRQKNFEKLDFEIDLWPLFQLEMEFQYYRVVMGQGAERQELEACENDARAMRRVIDSYLRRNPSQEPFDYRPLLDPVGRRKFNSGKEFALFVEQYLEEEIARARIGQAGSAIKSALDIWYEVRKEVGSIMQFGGLTPESHRRLIDYYFPRFKRIVFGPPTINIEKLLALVRAGLLDFSVARGPRVVCDETGGYFELRCEGIRGAVERAEILIDARYPSTEIALDATPLYRNLNRRGLIREFENPGTFPTESGYSPGAIDMTPGSQFVIDADGSVNEDIAVIGIPTEGNLVGNKTIVSDEFPGRWAAEVISQLRSREEAPASERADTTATF